MVLVNGLSNNIIFVYLPSTAGIIINKYYNILYTYACTKKWVGRVCS